MKNKILLSLFTVSMLASICPLMAMEKVEHENIQIKETEVIEARKLAKPTAKRKRQSKPDIDKILKEQEKVETLSKTRRKAPAVPFIKNVSNKLKKIKTKVTDVCSNPVNSWKKMGLLEKTATGTVAGLGTLFAGFLAYKALSFVWAPIRWLAYIGGTLGLASGATHLTSNPENKSFTDNMVSKFTGMFNWVSKLFGGLFSKKK